MRFTRSDRWVERVEREKCFLFFLPFLLSLLTCSSLRLSSWRRLKQAELWRIAALSVQADRGKATGATNATDNKASK